MSKVFILTLTWNAIDKLTKLKDSLLPALNNIDYTWLIRDNGSKDNTVEIASTWEGNIKVIPHKNNTQNFSTGMNSLFNEASPADNDYILLLNNDVIFNDSTSLHNMINILDKDNSVGVVGAKLLYTGTNKLQHAGVVIDDNHKMPMHYRCNQTDDKIASKNREFQAVTAAVLLTRSELFKNVCTFNKSGNKGMDENFHWAFDDISMCFSIKYNMDKKIIYCGNTNIFHEESASLKKVPTNKLFMSHNTNYFLNLWKNRYVLDHNNYKKDINHKLYER